MQKKTSGDRRIAGRVRPRATALEYGPATFLSFILRKTTSGPLPLVNVSRTGCQFLSREPLESGARLRVKLKPGGLTPIALTAEVTWCRPVPGKGVFRIGASFPDAGRKASGQLSTLLALGGLKAAGAPAKPGRA